eukprot:2954427-Rhodomonas_salina.1
MNPHSELPREGGTEGSLRSAGGGRGGGVSERGGGSERGESERGGSERGWAGGGEGEKERGGRGHVPTSPIHVAPSARDPPDLISPRRAGSTSPWGNVIGNLKL